MLIRACVEGRDLDRDPDCRNIFFHTGSVKLVILEIGSSLQEDTSVKGQARSRRQAIVEEWMINDQDPTRSISRLKRRSTYSDLTLWWLVTQLELLDAEGQQQLSTDGF
jgi:hypothetical protein